MDTATVTRKGQVTIPRRVRELLAIKTGDRLALSLAADGSLHLRPVRNEKRPLKGLLSEYGKDAGVVDEERIRRALRDRAATRSARTLTSKSCCDCC